MAVRKSVRGLVLVVAAILALNNTALAGPPDADEQAKGAVQALIDKFNTSWDKENGPALIGEVLSDKAFVLLRPDKQPGEPARARVQNKQGYIEGFRTYIQKANLQQHEHRIQSITVMGPIAYEFGIIVDVGEDGGEQRGEVLNIFAKEDVGWRLVFSTSPEFFKKQPTDFAADEKTVRKLARRFLSAFRSKRPTPFEQFEDMLADDVTIVSSAGDARVGKKAVVEFYREQVAGVREKFSDAEFEWTGLTAKMVGDGAVAFGRIVVEARGKADGQPVRLEIWATLVFRKEAGGWKIVEEQSTLAQPESPSKR